MNESAIIQQELNWRLSRWAEIQARDEEDLEPRWLRELGVYGGAQGIWVDKTRTKFLSGDGIGVTVGILHTGRHYPDDLSDEGVIYHYPSTNRPPSRDENEVSATKNAERLSLPVFLILPGERSIAKRQVRIGWVEDWDDDGRLFLISLGGEGSPAKTRSTEPREFSLEDENKQSYALAKTRPNQQRFRFKVLQNYGHKCAVCSIKAPQLIVAAHIRGKGDRGSDDWQNGIPLCPTHHTAFDLHMFSIEPRTKRIVMKPGLKPDAVGIVHENLSIKRNSPHEDALDWRWDRAQRAWK